MRKYISIFFFFFQKKKNQRYAYAEMLTDEPQEIALPPLDMGTPSVERKADNSKFSIHDEGEAKLEAAKME